MPAFPERESSILAVLKKKKPGRVPENEIREGKSPAPITNHQNDQATVQVMNQKQCSIAFTCYQSFLFIGFCTVVCEGIYS